MTSRFLKGARRPSPAATITAAIVARLDAGAKPWVRPWRTTGHCRPLRACGVPYQGINVFWLWLIADAHGYRSPFWLTYRQAQERGGQVRKGETASIAVLMRTYRAAEQVGGGSEDDPADRRERRVLKSYAVFNADQIDGLSAQYHPGFQDLAGEPEGRAEALDRFFGAIPAQLRHQGDQAYYEPLADRISMPPANLFENYDHYYATLAHELSHWTGHESRLARDLRHRFGTAAYAAEELVAELSSAMLGAELGLPVAHLDHHASYIGNWLELLRADDRAIMTAAAKAEEASRLLLALGGVDAHRGNLTGCGDEAASMSSRPRALCVAKAPQMGGHEVEERERERPVSDGCGGPRRLSRQGQLR